MGEFTQNLLKLTEFPFSYSFIGLLALIFGQGINLGDMAFDKIGPLLILMGFVATTLSISDPVGTLQRRRLTANRDKLLSLRTADEMLSKQIWGMDIAPYFSDSPYIFPPPYLFAIAYSPEGIRKESGLKINWDLIELKFYEAKKFSPKFERSKKDMETERREEKWTPWGAITSPVNNVRAEDNVNSIIRALKSFHIALQTEYDKIGERNIIDMGKFLADLKDQTVTTKWITAEIDKISALIYFIMVILLFIIASFLVPNFLGKFAQSFGYIQPPNLGIWVYLQPINLGILAFSVIALFVIIYMLRLRLNLLESKALIVFKYLTALGAIKTAKDKFESTLDDIERYLNENHWTLAEYWVNRIQADYSEVFLNEVK